MRLEVGTFRIREVVFGRRTRLESGVLELNKQELLDGVLKDPYVARADIDIARPGEPTRIIEYENIIEPKLKVEGVGTPYPGVCGRPTEMVGAGRTHRLGGVSVIECLDLSDIPEAVMGESRQWGREHEQHEVREGTLDSPVHHRFLDMSGPGAVTPYASLINVCLVVKPVNGLPAQEQHYVSFSNSLKLADRLAELTRGLKPHEEEVFDTTPKPGLPGVVYIPHMASTEPVVGAKGTYGTAVYGQVRLSAPWYLTGTEMLDGAVCGGGAGAVSGGGATWRMANNPIVMALWRRHTKELNFLGCLIQRTNWTNQNEYRMAADRASQLCLALGVRGAILTTDIRGQRWVGTMLTLQSCEGAGIKTVLLTEEEDNENGGAPPLLFSSPEFAAGVSTGTGDVPGFNPVSRVIGTIERAPEAWFRALPPIHGRYGVTHVQDYFGFGKDSYGDFFVPPIAQPVR
ncbi:MAG: glycine/sarcosine/betaine reductase component B subunit [Chloroflexota bacterium]|nr:glycine/sarcosine/betaine reductase component B subunit [Chloroflexota bacterium]